MFSIRRFDGTENGGNGGEDKQEGTSRLDRRIALLNQRKAQQQQQQAPVSTNDASSGSVAPPTAVPSAGGLNIHPSRLAASHVLRHSDRKSRSSANGTAKEKTKAKQRYLSKKKEKRKKRKAAAIASAPKNKAVTPKETQTQDLSKSETSSSVSSSEEESEADSDDDDDDDDVAMDEPKADEPTTDETKRDATKNEDHEQSEQRNETGTEEAALMRLPAPRNTVQASRRDLAAQGLPQGLAHPVVVDAAHSSTVVSKDAQSALNSVSDSMKARLGKSGITEWFAVQTSIIPLLLSHPSAYDLYPFPPPGDVCVSSPTGSGKTLSYVVPIVEVLQRRICRRLRALIILPTRDLVHQVRETIEALAKGTGLTCASVTGQQSFAHEQSTLIEAPSALLKRTVPGVRTPVRGSEEERKWIEQQQRIAFGDEGRRTIESKVDICIATPGRLIDHMEQTPGFTLEHLRFLVIDEADRLLSQSFQEWLPRVLQAIEPPKNVNALSDDPFEAALHPSWLAARSEARTAAAVDERRRSACTVQKMLFSATLTRDPAKIVALQLRNATFVSVEDAQQRKMNDGDDNDEAEKDWQDSFALPSTLHEHMLVTSTQNKPLHLLHLLYTSDAPLRQVLCFTKSVESATRLVKLLEFFDAEWKQRRRHQDDPALVFRHHSSDLRGAQRTQLLRDMKNGTVDVVVCSDVIARGIDLPDVRHVVSYDAPVEMAKYVHRVGRTARAGREGDAWTLVEEQEARHFTHMIRRAGRWTQMDKVRPPKPFRARLRNDDDGEGGKDDKVAKANDDTYDDLFSAYRRALQQLEAHFTSSSSSSSRKRA